VLDRQSALIEHRCFSDIGCYLRPGDLLVVNDTKVLPARLKGRKADTGAKVEILLLTQQKPEIATPRQVGTRNDDTSQTWEVLAKPAKRLKIGSRIIFDKDLEAEVIEEHENGRRLIKFYSQEPLMNMLQKVGEVPLPPYITKPLLHKERYQTIYAQRQESAAAPTAGLHFTPELIDDLKLQGVKLAYLTLRIGLDTFQPIREETVENHHIHSEYYELSQETADLLNEARNSKGRIIAVGTTSARVLEALAGRSFAKAQDDICQTSGHTNLFIYPGYKFKAIDLMITNFHLPRTTLLAMVSAFAGLDKIKAAYKEAVNEKYRFFSFGDAMLIL
jgi:S-adenosylmethionine:tRNA ribosyltransferase-isomerase